MVLHKVLRDAPIDVSDFAHAHSLPKGILVQDFDGQVQRIAQQYRSSLENPPVKSPEMRDLRSLNEQVFSLRRACERQQRIAALIDPPRWGGCRLRDREWETASLDTAVGNFRRAQTARIQATYFYNTIYAAKILADINTIRSIKQFLGYPVSQNATRLPKTTQRVALQMFAGENNPFMRARPIKFLGKGSCGQVHLVEVGSQKYAAKTFFQWFQEVLDREYSLLIQCDHPHIIRVAYADGKTLYLEFAEGGDLSQKRPKTFETAREILDQIADAMAYLHDDLGYLHGDLKLNNVLCMEGCRVKIGDFGLSLRIADFREGEHFDYRDYLSPEYQQGRLAKRDCTKEDVWAFGVILWNWLTPRHCHLFEHSRCPKYPFQGFDRAQLESKLEPRQRQTLDPTGEFVELMMRCFDPTPQKRPSMQEIRHILRSIENRGGLHPLVGARTNLFAQDIVSAIRQIEQQYQTALEDPRKEIILQCEEEKVAWERVDDRRQRMTHHRAISCEMFEKVRTILRVNDFLRYPVSRDPERVPHTTRQIALRMLTGVPDPFQQVRIEKILVDRPYGRLALVDVAGQKYIAEALYPLFQSNFDREYDSLVLFNHESIVRVAYANGRVLYLESVVGTLVEKRPETPKEIRNILSQIAQALAYIHHIGSVHKKLILEHIFLTPDGEAKVGGFLVSHSMQDFKQGEKLPYDRHLPPELIEGVLSRKDCQKIDVWSFGVVVWDLLTSKCIDLPRAAPFQGFDRAELEKHLDPRKRQILDPTGMLVDLMIRCLNGLPQDRPSMLDVLQILAHECANRFVYTAGQ